MRLSCLFMLWGLLSQPLLAAPLTLLPLKHQLPAQVIPSLRPLLGPQDKLLAVGDQLGVVTDPDTLVQLKRVLDELDRPLHRLLITLRSNQQTQQQDVGVHGRGGIVIGQGKPQARLDADIAARQQQGNQQLMQQIQTVEGGQAQLYVGYSYPLAMNSYRWQNGQWTAQSQWVYVDVASGFTAKAQLRGDQVALTIAPQVQQRGENGIEGTRLQTELEGPLGEWLPLGSSQQDTRQQKYGSSLGLQRQAQQIQLWIKVERLN